MCEGFIAINFVTEFNRLFTKTIFNIILNNYKFFIRYTSIQVLKNAVSKSVLYLFVLMLWLIIEYQMAETKSKYAVENKNFNLILTINLKLPL